MHGRGGRFRQLDCTQFRRPLVVPAPMRRAAGGNAGQLDLFKAG